MSRVVVVRATGLVTVQDAGRPGFMHQGIPRGGPLSPSSHAVANESAGNAAAAAAIEVMGELEVRAEVDGIVAATDDGEPRMLARGESVVVRSESMRRVRYLALSGGIDVPVVFGGRGTLVVARLGGHEGRVLRRGDELPLGGSLPRSIVRREPRALPPDPSLVRVVLGPDHDDFDDAARARFFDAMYVVSAATDRTGTRLDGPALALRTGGGRRPSAPMLPGAVQIPPDGRPIVLGPDGPTTGGYPLIAVVVSSDLERVVAAPIGARVQFAALA